MIEKVLQFLEFIKNLTENNVDTYFQLTSLLSQLDQQNKFNVDNKYIVSLNTAFSIGISGNNNNSFYLYSDTSSNQYCSLILSLNIDGYTHDYTLLKFYFNYVGCNLFYFEKIDPVPALPEGPFTSFYCVVNNLFNFVANKVPDDKIFCLKTSYVDIDNNLVVNDINKNSGFGLSFGSTICLLKQIPSLYVYTKNDYKYYSDDFVFLNDVEGSFTGLVPSNHKHVYLQSCSVPELFKTVHYDVQTTAAFYLTEEIDFEPSDYDDYTSPPYCSSSYDIDCTDCNQVNDVFRTVFNALQMLANSQNKGDDDMPDYTQILININANLANIHNDLHATVLDEQDNPVDMNVPQALVEVNNSIQADSDKPIIVGNEDVSPWSAV